MKLSIITVNLNNRDGLQKTIDSVVAQTYKDFEWIVIDGGSTDGSKELIEQYADHFAYWVSEPDKGIYNAMNKGIKVANGEYLQFLNSGDFLRDDNVLMDFVKSNFSADIVDGDIHLIYDDREVDAIAPEKVSFDFFIHGTIWHPCAFIKKSLFDKNGCYNEEFKIISDWEFFMKSVVVHGATYAHFCRIVACFPVDGISADESNEEKKEGVRKTFLQIMPESAYEAYLHLDRKNMELQEVKDEYENLMNGKLGPIVKLLLMIKNKRK